MYAPRHIFILSEIHYLHPRGGTFMTSVNVNHKARTYFGDVYSKAQCRPSSSKQNSWS